jgi:Type VII secretion system ESX-1, transport TM domain B
MAGRRDLIEAGVFRRRRAVAVFTRGSRHQPELPERHPNRWLLGGLGLVVVGMLVGGVHGIATSGPPPGWNADGTLLVDRSTGGRYLVVEGRLRPVLNLTSLLLVTSGDPPEPVRVAHNLLARQPLGPALGIPETPERPPAPRPPTSWTACARAGSDGIQLLLGSPTGGDPTPAGLLARPAGGSGVRLVTGGRAFPITATALGALGYARSQVQSVPARWLALVPRGPTLRVIRPQGAAAAATAGSLAEALVDGGLVRDRATGRRYLVEGGRLRPVLNKTSLLLLAGPAAVPVPIDHARVLAGPLGPDVGIAEAPQAPPPVPPAGTRPWACLDSDRAALRVADRLPVPAGLGRADPGLVSLPAPPTTSPPVPTLPPVTAPSPATSAPAAPTTTGPAARPQRPATRGRPLVRLWQAPGSGDLVRVPAAAGREVSEKTPVWLVADGRAFAITSGESLAALGYGAAEPAVLPSAWLALVPKGPPLLPLRR